MNNSIYLPTIIYIASIVLFIITAMIAAIVLSREKPKKAEYSEKLGMTIIPGWNESVRSFLWREMNNGESFVIVRWWNKDLNIMDPPLLCRIEIRDNDYFFTPCPTLDKKPFRFLSIPIRSFITQSEKRK